MTTACAPQRRAENSLTQALSLEEPSKQPRFALRGPGGTKCGFPQSSIYRFRALSKANAHLRLLAHAIRRLTTFNMGTN